MKDNISIDTFKDIVKAGIIMGQANPNKNVDKLVKVVVKELLNQLMEVQNENNPTTKKQLLDEMTTISQECKLYDEEFIDNI